MNYIADLEHDLMSYCLKHKGKWWANHFFRNREVDALYDELRQLDLGTVTAIVGNGTADYQKQIDIYNKIVAPVLAGSRSASEGVSKLAEEFPGSFCKVEHASTVGITGYKEDRWGVYVGDGMLGWRYGDSFREALARLKEDMSLQNNNPPTP